MEVLNLAALQLLRNEMKGKTVAVLICDSGSKYFSTNLWESQDIQIAR